LTPILELWRSSEEYQAMLRALRRGPAEETVVGLQGSERNFLAAALFHDLARGGLVVTAGELEAERAQDELSAWLQTVGGPEVAFFRGHPVLPFEVVAESREGEGERLAILHRLARGDEIVVVTTVDALVGRLPPPRVLRAARLRIRVGDRLDLAHVADRLVASGYERVERVEAKGTFALRGGILDVWDPSADHPLRVDLFDVEVASLRPFDPESQRSRPESLSEVEVGPAREVAIEPQAWERGLTAIRRDLAQQVVRLRQSDRRAAAEALGERVEELLAEWREGIKGRGREALTRYLPYFYPEQTTLADYLPEGALVFLVEPERIREAAAAVQREAAERAVALLESGHLLPHQADVVVGFSRVERLLARHPTVHASLLLRRSQVRLGAVHGFSARTVETFHGQWEALAGEVGRLAREGYRCLILASTKERLETVRDRLVAAELLPVRAARAPEPGEIVLAEGSLENGFQLPDLRLWVLTDRELFGRERKRRRAEPVFQEAGTAIRSHLELRPGDYVVHVHHGIGQYMGVETMEVAGVRRDYLTIRYQGADRLFVPVDQLHLVQKYVAQEGHVPKLYKLGGGDWQKVKARVKESVREMAGELLRLQAARRARPGHAFGPDTPWQRELEDAFPYQETRDQLRALEEIKRDLESPRPMDRLLCGDVGYGKTELAIRAAFKVAQEGKQVAVLVPTTILAQQHFNTFTSRMAGFPVVIDLLTRFRSRKEQAATLKGLREGVIDIVIGTHRLLANDVRFHDLGLLIVDEEQRFGVAHKERLKFLKERVDVLTLTATPIPRTLHMSLVGLKDISLIETPPEDRHPVQTYVVEYSDDLVRQAILREIERGGQVFYVHNRVETIEEARLRVKELVPEARVAVAHGQMKEDLLERTMLDFLDGEYDVLVTTTIVESGLDIPSVNTLIVEDADHLGLAQMYQLRGRIGRSNRQAYAYFTYRPQKVLSEVAEKRLEAIREFTEFGAGFKIAMRDLEIRGAGNILGPEQSGFIMAVGFDLYVQLLEEAVRELEGQPVEEKTYPTVDVPVDAYIPADYIADERQKIDVYKRVASAESIETVEEIEAELEDRFGPLPSAVQHLLWVARLRILGERAGLAAIRVERQRARLIFDRVNKVDLERLGALGRQFRGRAMFLAGSVPEVTVRLGGADLAALRETEEVLKFLVEPAVTAVS
jgi:transcription-repair coupling factor (superfamily II helicase)